jgi:hypothetical protein
MQEERGGEPISCDPEALPKHGKEGVDGSSPSEGFQLLPAQTPFVLPLLAGASWLRVHRASTRRAPRWQGVERRRPF